MHPHMGNGLSGWSGGWLCVMLHSRGEKLGHGPACSWMAVVSPPLAGARNTTNEILWRLAIADVLVVKVAGMSSLLPAMHRG